MNSYSTQSEDALTEAQNVMRWYESARDSGEFNDLAMRVQVLTVVQAHAAIAQAEQLKRIADRLELITNGDVYGNGHLRVNKAEW
jgi:hypothetical protein